MNNEDSPETINRKREMIKKIIIWIIVIYISLMLVFLVFFNQDFLHF